MAGQLPQTQDRAADAPSARTILSASALALLVSAVLLIAAVLPAEYGIDPLGTGRALGLTALSDGLAEAPLAPPRGDKVAPVAEGPFALYPAAFKVDSRDIVLGPYEYAEFKYHLEQGATMLFAWRASGDVKHDMHGDRDDKPGGEGSVSFDARPRRAADGSFTAPFSGIHGWYWENLGGETITVRLTTAGFYTTAHQFRFDRTRADREVRDLDTIPPVTGEEAR